MSEEKVLASRVERYQSVNDPAEPTPIKVEPVPAATNAPVTIEGESTVVAVEPEADAEQVETAEKVSAQNFHLFGQVGQFLLPVDALTTQPSAVRAIFDVMWIVGAQNVPTQPGAPQLLHYVAYCPLFRKLTEGEQIPPYDVTTYPEGDGIAVHVDEQPIPEPQRIVVPKQEFNRKERREMEHHARKLGIITQ